MRSCASVGSDPVRVAVLGCRATARPPASQSAADRPTGDACVARTDMGIIVRTARACTHAPVCRCKTQRKSKKAGTLSADRVAALEKLQFNWVVNKFAPFEDYYRILLEYKEKHDGADPPTNMKAEVRFGRKFNIASWCDKIRRLHKKGVLPQDQVVRMRMHMRMRS